MRDVRNAFENWSFFANPVTRIAKVIDRAVERLRAIDLKEPITPTFWRG
jgi:hypothetical protein